MIDFTGVRNKEVTIGELCGHLTVQELRDLTNEMIDTVLGLIADSTDADVVFEPEDPNAQDDAAADDAEVNMPWTLGHVIVHMTASSEEGAALAAEMARGVEREGRSRSEVPWETVTTIAQCRARLEESRRMRLASLDMWPDEPHMDNTQVLGFLEGPINPASRFCAGLYHADSHLGQVEDVVNQAKAARSYRRSS